jgi:hypothetical protein
MVCRQTAPRHGNSKNEPIPTKLIAAKVKYKQAGIDSIHEVTMHWKMFKPMVTELKKAV